VIGSLRELVPPTELTQDAVRRALLVGWCIELVRHTHSVIASISTLLRYHSEMTNADFLFLSSLSAPGVLPGS
jgi:hypothetical protein